MIFMLRFLAGIAFAGMAAAAAAPSFEVASIKPLPSDPLHGSEEMNTGHGRLSAKNVTLQRCITSAFQIGPNQLSGGPSWMNTQRFDIEARSAANEGDALLMSMLQSLLAERFKMAFHRETRPIEAYVLEVAKNGLKLEKAADGNAGTYTADGRIDATGITMDRLAQVLSRSMDLPVVNRTGVDGAFNLKLQYTPEKLNAAADRPSDGASIFTAIQEQLGLRLRAQKVPIEILVIDQAQMPEPN
jgi:uncharacterized protein (TIGR03435 family)